MAKKAEKSEEKDVEAVEAAEVETTEEIKEEAESKPAAKAGKRSPKALKEAEEKAEKEQRKAKGEVKEGAAPEPKRGPAPKTRPKAERRSKRYKEARKVIKGEELPLKSALEQVVQASNVKFDAAVEMHIKLNVDPKQADQNIRGSIVLPNGTGKNQRVAVFAPKDKHAEAKSAGADIVAEDELLEQLKKEVIDFDILIATPQLMSQLGRFAKLLGPKGLMPNPKSGTVTNNVGEAVSQAKAGRLEFRVDSYGIIHRPIGKVSFGADKLEGNAQALIDAVKGARPASVKGSYMERVFVNATMGPSVSVKL